MNKYILWILRILASLIMLQTLFFKFTAAPESIYIFTKLGMEPWGRIGTGVGELIASILILYPRTNGYGGLLGAGLMGGALFFHLTTLGISIPNSDGTNDGGQLFIYALIVFVCSIVLALVYKNQPLSLLNRIKGKK